MEKTTYNKDGSLRKKGSGRPKGSTSFANVRLVDLQKFVGENTQIPVRKTWLHKVAVDLIDRVEDER